MKLLFSLLKHIQFIYPVKIFLQRRVADYFFHYHVSELLKHASSRYKISDRHPISLIKNKPAFRGTVKEIFRTNSFYPEPIDFAVALKVATGEFGNQADQFNDAIIDLAYHLAIDVKNRIATDELLKGSFSELGKDLKKLDANQKRDIVVSIFEDKKSLFTRYFDSFQDTRFSSGIKVWHQSQENCWIEWGEKDSITVNLDLLRVREGFFLVGFDYSDAQTGDSLMIATTKHGYEYFNGLDVSSNDVWVR